MEPSEGFEKWFEDLMRQHVTLYPRAIYEIAERIGRQKCEVQTVRKHLGDRVLTVKDSDGRIVWRWNFDA